MLPKSDPLQVHPRQEDGCAEPAEPRAQGARLVAVPAHRAEQEEAAHAVVRWMLGSPLAEVNGASPVLVPSPVSLASPPSVLASPP